MLQLLNANGMLQMKLKLQKGENSINTSMLSTGVYIYKVLSQGKISSGKWIKY